MEEKMWLSFSTQFSPENPVRHEEISRYPKVKEAWEFWQMAWRLGVEVERDACAKTCEARRRTVSNGNGLSMLAHDPASIEAGYCADAIRERSNAK